MMKGISLAGALALSVAPINWVVAQSAPGLSEPGAVRSAGAPEIGMPVFSLDGQKMGTVENVSMSSDGRVETITITTGSILGFGLKLVAISSEQVHCKRPACPR